MREETLQQQHQQHLTRADSHSVNATVILVVLSVDAIVFVSSLIIHQLPTSHADLTREMMCRLLNETPAAFNSEVRPGSC